MKLKVIAQTTDGRRWEESGYHESDSPILTEEQMLDKLPPLVKTLELQMIKETRSFMYHDENNKLVCANPDLQIVSAQ